MASRIVMRTIILDSMDPLTAALNALASFNQFLCTPEGQKLAAANAVIVARLLDVLGIHMVANSPAPAAK